MKLKGSTGEWIVCRICLGQPSTGLQSIFHQNDDQDLTLMILECGGVPIKKLDHYPDKICSKCLMYLKTAYKFRTTCQRSHEDLARFIAPVDEGSEKQQMVDGNVHIELEFKVEPKDIKEEFGNEIALVNEDRSIELELKLESENVKEETENEIALVNEGGDELELTVESKDVQEEIENEVILYIIDEDETDDDETEAEDEAMEDETEEFIKEDKTYEAKNIDELENELLANKSVKDTEPKRKSLRKIKPKEINSESLAEGLSNHCGNSYSTRKRKHMKKVQKKHYDCEICGRGFPIKSSLERHMRTHTGERPYKCSYCPSTFADLDTVTKHHRTHTNERPFVCNICGKSFASNLKRHKRLAHNMIYTGEKPQKDNKPKPFACKTCGRAFAQKPHLARHMLTHTGERPYKCSYCPKSFADSDTVNKHHRTHTNERPYVCDICGKSFTANILKSHKFEAHGIIPTREKTTKPRKSYNCKICERIFTQKPHLTRHMLTHTDERPYKCSYCLQTFRDASTVRKHHRWNKGITPTASGQKCKPKRNFDWLYDESSAES